MNAKQAERSLMLLVRNRPLSGGITQASKEHFLGHRDSLGPIVRVHLVYVTEPSWEYLTYLEDDKGRALVLDGFAWGYPGEGPRGLHWLIVDELGWPRSVFAQIARVPAHTEGIWSFDAPKPEEEPF